MSKFDYPEERDVLAKQGKLMADIMTVNAEAQLKRAKPDEVDAENSSVRLTHHLPNTQAKTPNDS